MIREAFVVIFATETPYIKKVEITDKEGVSWRDAKKLLRAHYLEKAAGLRKLSQKDYFLNA